MARSGFDQTADPLRSEHQPTPFIPPTPKRLNPFDLDTTSVASASACLAGFSPFGHKFKVSTPAPSTASNRSSSFTRVHRRPTRFNPTDSNQVAVVRRP